jgi:RNA polymerase sigma-70 factor (ECF subfamily)
MHELEAALIEAAKSDPEAFAELVVRYQDRLYNYLYRMTGSREDAQDLTQETLVRAYRALPRFNIEQPFRPWVYKIATNLAINHLKGRKPALELEEWVPGKSLDDSPEHWAESREVQRIISQSIAELPETYRTVVLLRHVEDMAYEEIARALDVPLGTAKVRLHRARALLQEKLAAAGLHAQAERFATEDTTVTL